MKEVKEKATRFDTRIPAEQKRLFEKAATLGGYRNLTSFILGTVQARANEIIKQQEQILASNRDMEIFFEALMNPNKANDAFIKAAQEYKAKYIE